MSVDAKTKWGFALYDFSNSGYVIIFQSLVFPIMFISVAQQSFQKADSLWGWLVAASSILSIVAAPFLGAYADAKGRSRIFSLFVLSSGLIAVIVSLFLFDSLAGLIIGFLIFNTLFEFSESLYDSFLRRLTTTIHESTTLSSFGWGVGYVGSAVFVALNLLGERFALSKQESLVAFAILFIFLSIPAIRFFSKRDKPAVAAEHVHQQRPAHRPSSPVSWKQLFIYWIIGDCVAAIFYFAPLYAQREIGIELRTLGALVLAALMLAFPLTVLMGRIANRIGHVKVIRLCLVLWVVILIGLYIAHSIAVLIGVLVLLAFVVGSTQAILRAHYSVRVKRDLASEGFGFYAVAQKSATVLSPALVALVTTLTGTMRPAFAVLGVLVIVAFFLAGKLPIAQGLGDGGML